MTPQASTSDDDMLPPGNIGGVSGAPRQGPGGGPQILGAPPQILGQISRSDDPLGGAPSDGPIDLSQDQPGMAPARRPDASQPVPGVTPKYANAQPTPSARDEYDSAYGYILNGEYDLAERSFKTFLANHPTDRRAGSAQYWLGESYFQRNLHREATDAFLKSYTQYPDDVKAPDSLLKLGLAYQGLGERKAACNAYDELLSKYSKASKALRDRAQFEKTRGKCA
jgi:tol-pal system protein YbgF